MFAPEDRWVWDFWLAESDGVHHLYFLQAPKALGDPDLRHRNATVGHATSTDLRQWREHGTVLRPGPAGAVDETATWTGSVVQDDSGLWRMYYTGTVWDATGNTQTIALATSPDLFTWTKRDTFALSADERWYETRGQSSWPEEAWRDPWVHRDAEGRWHMLITARANCGPVEERGVVGHAVSDDLDHWEVVPPLTEPGQGFGHLEVPQLVSVDRRPGFLFSTATQVITPARRADGGTGVWWAPVEGDQVQLHRAAALTDDSLYSGKVVQLDGEDVLLAFALSCAPHAFAGHIVDPLHLRWIDDRLVVG
jgi:beta-fructofuranosidase